VKLGRVFVRFRFDGDLRRIGEAERTDRRWQDKRREVRPVGSGTMTGTSREVRLAPQPAQFDKGLKE
jgi:hypothetical protein